MKRLLTTTAALGLMVAAATATAIPVPALAGHDVWNILQDFDINSVPPPNIGTDQNVDNVINGGNVGGSQTGTNLANSFNIVDPNDEAGPVGDDYNIRQIFDEDQIVNNTANAVGHVGLDQSGTNIVNLGQITDTFGGTTDGDTYDIEQLTSSNGDEDGSQLVSNTIGGGASSIGASSQTGQVQANALTIIDSAGGVSSAGSLTVTQRVAEDDAFDQAVRNTATAGSIDGLAQSGVTKVNLLTLDLSNQTGGLMVDVTQDTDNDFNQSIVNTATATAGSAVNVAQSGSNAGNVITIPTN